METKVSYSRGVYCGGKCLLLIVFFLMDNSISVINLMPSLKGERAEACLHCMALVGCLCGLKLTDWHQALLHRSRISCSSQDAKGRLKGVQSP